MSKLAYDIKNLKGYVLGVGILNDKILTCLEKNDYVEVNILTNNNIEIPKKSKLNNNEQSKKGKKIIIRKLKKYFKYQKPDYIICNVDDVLKHLKYFVKDSLAITKDKIYIYSNSSNVSLEEIAKKYRRYTKDVQILNDYILINTVNYKSRLFKNMFYYVIDTLQSLYNVISNVLTS